MKTINVFFALMFPFLIIVKHDLFNLQSAVIDLIIFEKFMGNSVGINLQTRIPKSGGGAFSSQKRLNQMARIILMMPRARF